MNATHPTISPSAERINTLAEMYKAENYLEIGIKKGETFFNVRMPHKIAADPTFEFLQTPYANKNDHFLSMTSDALFAYLGEKNPAESLAPFINTEAAITFDIIFLNGAHSFEKTFCDFKNCLQYTHKNTLIIIDNTVPCDPYSALPDQKISYARRKRAGLSGSPWHGDVFKTIFAIHDFYPEYSYSTLMGTNPQTFVWRAEKAEERSPVFSSIEKIAQLSYFDMLDYSWVLLPVNNMVVLSDLLGMTLTPAHYASNKTWEKLVYRKLDTQK